MIIRENNVKILLKSSPPLLNVKALIMERPVILYCKAEFTSFRSLNLVRISGVWSPCDKISHRLGISDLINLTEHCSLLACTMYIVGVIMRIVASIVWSGSDAD